MKEIDISRAIIGEYRKRLLDNLENDVIIVGAGPAGLTASYYLAKSGIKTLVLEKGLSIGGGIWGGAAGNNVLIVEDREILEEFDVDTKTNAKENLYIVDAIELATALGYKAKKAGAEILNLTQVEDIILKNNTLEGLVVNNTAIKIANLHVDPFCISSKYIVDATGHSAEIVNMLIKKRVKGFYTEDTYLGEGPMDVETAEKQVVEKTGEVYPRLYVAGMSVCSTYNLPRMGPIFGGMLKSGKKAAELIKEEI